MRARLFGRLTRPAVCAIGVWDPILPGHQELYRRLITHARDSELSSLIISINPDPVLHLYGASECPVYSDARARIAQMLSFGLDGVLHVRFQRRDIEATAADFFEVLDQEVEIAELWLGSRQTLGRFESGNFETIRELAKVRRIRLKRLPLQQLGTSGVRQLLREGNLREAAALVGRPPIRMRPASGVLRLAWHPGRYTAVPVPGPNAPVKGTSVELELNAQKSGLPRLVWPQKKVSCLAFVSGPGDLAALAGSGPAVLNRDDL